MSSKDASHQHAPVRENVPASGRSGSITLKTGRDKLSVVHTLSSLDGKNLEAYAVRGHALSEKTVDEHGGSPHYYPGVRYTPLHYLHCGSCQPLKILAATDQLLLHCLP